MQCFSARLASRPIYGDANANRSDPEDVRRLRPAVHNEGVVRRPLKVGILEIDVGEAVPCRRQIDQPSSHADQWRNPVDEDKVARMIDAELCFEAVRGMPKRCGHHSRICNNDVKGLSRRQQDVSAGAHAFASRSLWLLANREPEESWPPSTTLQPHLKCNSYQSRL